MKFLLNKKEEKNPWHFFKMIADSWSCISTHRPGIMDTDYLDIEFKMVVVKLDNIHLDTSK